MRPVGPILVTFGTRELIVSQRQITGLRESMIPDLVAELGPARQCRRGAELTGRARRGSLGGRPPAFDKQVYKRRTVVERCINRLNVRHEVAHVKPITRRHGNYSEVINLNDHKMLSETQVDQLADALEAFVADAQSTSFHNYPLAHDTERKLGVQRSVSFPRAELTTSATFGLAHEDWAYANFPDRVELVHTWSGASLDQERFLVTVAEAIISGHYFPRPGTIYEDSAMSAGLDDLARIMPHGLLLYPYLYGDRFERSSIDGLRVWFLQLVPIYDEEKTFIQKNGFNKFEELLEFDGVRFHDLKRLSHVAR